MPGSEHQVNDLSFLFLSRFLHKAGPGVWDSHPPFHAQGPRPVHQEGAGLHIPGT